MGRLYEDDDYDAIERACRKELKQTPKSLDALYFLIAIRLNQGQFDEATPYILRFEQYHNGLEAEELRLLRDTYTRLDDYSHMDARYAALYYEIGKRHFVDGAYTRALHWLLKAKSIYYSDPLLNFYMGIGNKEIGNFTKALKYLERQLEIDPKEPSPNYNIACVYAVQGKVDEAVHWLGKAIKAHPEFRRQARSDKDFDNIRNSAKFAALMAE